MGRLEEIIDRKDGDPTATGAEALAIMQEELDRVRQLTKDYPELVAEIEAWMDGEYDMLTSILYSITSQVPPLRLALDMGAGPPLKGLVATCVALGYIAASTRLVEVEG